MDWKQLLGSITTSVDEELRLRNAYLAAENRILRQQISGRVHLTDSDRKALAEIGQQLGKKALEAIATIAQPATILAWHRQFAGSKVDTSAPRQSVGRPRIDTEIENLVVRMARENRSWGYDRIVGALANLGSTISAQTVGNILKRHGMVPAPERKKTVTWREFIRIHMDVLMATEFFTSDVWSWLGLLVAYLLRFLLLGCHRVRSMSHQTIQVMRSLVWHALERSAHGSRGVCVVTAFARSQAIRGGEGVLGTAAAAWVSREEQRSRSQAPGKVVFWSVVHPRKIRDGPLPAQQRLKGLVWDEHRQAA